MFLSCIDQVSALNVKIVRWIATVVVLFVPSALVFSDEQGYLLYEEDGLWVFSAPWEALNDWCEFYNQPGRSHGVSVYYDAPHDERLQKMGPTYKDFVLEKAVPAITDACGSAVEVTYLGVAMYQKPKNVASDKLLNDLKNNGAPLWDNALFKVEGDQLTTVKHEVREAAYHLNAEQIRALDPRNEAELQEYWAERDQAVADRMARETETRAAEAEAAAKSSTVVVAAQPVQAQSQVNGYSTTPASTTTANTQAGAGGGQVIKSDEFWDRLQFEGTVREIFEGDFSIAPSTLFKVYYSALQWAYSDSCKDFLPAGSVKRGYVTQTIYGDGYRDAAIEVSALISPRFIGSYDAFSDDVSKSQQRKGRNQGVQAEIDLARGGSISDIIGQSVTNNPINQLSRFISAAGGCETAAVYQLRENYLRAATGQPSLQASGVELTNAAAESAPMAASLYGACMARHDSYSKNYCLCFEWEAEDVLTADEKKLFVDDFQNYYDAMSEIRERPYPPASDRAWDLNELRYRCNN